MVRGVIVMSDRSTNHEHDGFSGSPISKSKSYKFEMKQNNTTELLSKRNYYKHKPQIARSVTIIAHLFSYGMFDEFCGILVMFVLAAFQQMRAQGNTTFITFPRGPRAFECSSLTKQVNKLYIFENR